MKKIVWNFYTDCNHELRLVSKSIHNYPAEKGGGYLRAIEEKCRKCGVTKTTLCRIWKKEEKEDENRD